MPRPLLPLALLALSILAFGCAGSDGGGDGNGGGGTGGSGGSGGGGGTGGEAPLDCSFEACGGDPTGTWNARRICSPSGSYRDDFPECDDAVVEGELEYSGTFTFEADGRYSQHTFLGGDFHHEYADACTLALTGGSFDAAAYCAVLGHSAASPDSPFHGTCAAADGLCVCDLTTDVERDVAGVFAVAGDTLVFDGAAAGNEFCANGNELKIRDGDGSILVFRR